MSRGLGSWISKSGQHPFGSPPRNERPSNPPGQKSQPAPASCFPRHGEQISRRHMLTLSALMAQMCHPERLLAREAEQWAMPSGLITC